MAMQISRYTNNRPVHKTSDHPWLTASNSMASILTYFWSMSQMIDETFLVTQAKRSPSASMYDFNGNLLT